MAIKIAGVDVINDDRELVLAKLTDINETINDTAVDVFIYDTSKDSDGGAWRHRTQHTSWYNEASSSTRGSRAEFPAVAVIVAEADKVTIYDGDDPSLPMWMVFDEGADFSVTTFIMQSAQLSSVTMRNAQLCVGDQTYDLYTANFISEKMLRYLDGGGGTQKFSGPIANRNSNMTTETVSTVGLINRAVNDVAMTVLPDAPTDPATGLPVPTIAVATNGGVSVIKDDGTVVDIAEQASDNEVEHIGFDEGNSLVYHERYSPTSDSHVIVFDAIPSADTTISTADAVYAHDQKPHLAPTDDINAYVLGAMANNGRAFSILEPATQGFSQLAEDPTTPANGMVAYTTSDYATGWMPGDIKLAALADTTAETFGDAVSGATVSDPNGDGVYDGEHVTNGDFATDTDWTKGSGWTISGGVASFSGGGLSGDDLIVYQDGNVITTGSIYEVTYTVSGRTSGTVAVFLRGSSPAVYHSTNETFTRYLVAGSSSRDIEILANDSFDGSIDNVSVRLADPDRSVNGKGLAVHGSITKAAVATGADLVAYSGFSGSNYLEQPYNSDLNFGTGDFCIMGWVKTDVSTATFTIFQITDKTGSSYGTKHLVVWGVGSSQQLRLRSSDGTNIVNLDTSFTIGGNTWDYVAVKRTGGTYYVYVNGVEVDSVAMASSDFTFGSGYSASIGPYWYNGSFSSSTGGALALIRISGTAPTADQIAKIYNDELPLFQPNAKATLTGTSDAVTALAHDPDTDLLHVGTSGGRSVFQGLRRVDETATAVTTAISAVDGLVVEQ